MSEKLKVGDHVCWESQSSGYSYAKHGQVVAIVPAGSGAEKIVEALIANRNRDGKKMTVLAATNLGGYRKSESYIVEVKNPKRGTRLHWPVTSQLSQTPGRVEAETKQEVAC